MAMFVNAGVTSAIEVEQKQSDLQKNKQTLIEYIGRSVIGSHHNTTLNTVFG